MAELRKQLEQVVREWENLAVAWNDEDCKNFISNTALGKVQPLLFMRTTRVITLMHCIEVLRNLLEAFPDG